jgi:hypothetical protein
MVRAVCSNLNYMFLGFFFTPLPQGRDQRSLTHQEVILEMALSQGVSKDSGYWDYALLMFYDEMVHIFIFSGITSLTNFGWAERTALVAAGALDVKNAPTLLNYVRGFSSFFVGFSRNFALLTIGLGLFILPDLVIAVGAIYDAAKALKAWL